MPPLGYRVSSASASRNSSAANRLVVPDVTGLSDKEAAHIYLDAQIMPHPWMPRRRKGKWEKVSCYSGFHFNDLDETHSDIDHWRPNWRCGLVVAESSGLIAGDVDDLDAFLAWLRDDRIELPRTAYSRTGRDGGYHLLFDGRDLKEWPKQGDMPGGDVKSNGFIGVEPSLHPSGRPYVWGDRYRVLSGDVFCEALLDWRAEQADINGSSGVDIKRLLEDGLDPERSHHSQLVGVVMKLCRQGQSQEETYRTYLDILDARPTPGCKCRNRNVFTDMWSGANEKVSADKRELAGLSEAVEAQISRQRGKNGRNLPGEFWGYMPELEHIRQAAYSRGRSADSVLGVVFTRMSAFAPVDLALDAGLGPTPITLFCALCGPPESGKSVSIQVGIALLPQEQFLLDGTFAGDLPLGSGEGIPEAYYATVPEHTGNGKTRPVRRKLYDQAFFSEDEGQKMVKTMSKGGNIIAETIRSAWSGNQLGQSNASKETTRKVNPGDYSIGIAVGFQPETIQALLSDEEAASGTPQRFLYLSATDPNVPRSLDDSPKWPGPLKIEWPEQVVFPASICDEVWEANTATSSGDSTVDVWSAHMYLMRLRFAAHLAILRHTKDETIAKVTDEDWEWSRVAWKTSVSVRDAMRAYGSRKAAESEVRTRNQIVGRAVAVEAAKEQRAVALDNAVGQAARHVQRENCDDGCKRRCITNAVKSKIRKLVDMDIVFSRLVAEGYVKEANADGVYAPGKKRAM